MPKPLIPKEIVVPPLNSDQIEALTNIIFMKYRTPEPCDVMFVFGGTHPGHWEKAIEAYRKGLSKKIIVTGGVSPTGVKHPEWRDTNKPEAEVIVTELIKNGVREDAIVY
jgi:hypothetical protein